MNLLLPCCQLLVLVAAASVLSACSRQQPCREPCVVFIGDSIISRWPALQPPGHISGLQIINHGLPGDTTIHMLSRLNHDVTQLRPRVVVILGGINDLARTPIPAIENNLASMAQTARQHHIQVVLVAIPPTGTPPSGQFMPSALSAQNQIRALNDSLKSLAGQNHYTFLDVHSALADDRGYYRPSLTTDGVHPTADAYRLLEPLLREAIASAIHSAAESSCPTIPASGSCISISHFTTPAACPSVTRSFPSLAYPENSSRKTRCNPFLAPASIRRLSKHQIAGFQESWACRRTLMGKLTNQVAVVTGASKGIGAGIAKALAAEGASVVVNYASSKTGADKVVQEIAAAGGKAVAVQADLSKPADVTRLFAETKKAYGKLNILVNNAGVYQWAPLDAVTEDLFHKHFNLNVLGLLLATKEAVKLIGPEGGSIINVGSGVSTINPANSSVYTATKAAVDSITGVLAKELGPRKIRVNSINPGLIETEGVQAQGFNEGDFLKWVESTSPLGRIGQPDDIAPTAVYLASSDSKYLTGETIRVTGGMY